MRLTDVSFSEERAAGNASEKRFDEEILTGCSIAITLPLNTDTHETTRSGLINALSSFVG